jgi:glycosyltransferase involved in cell wall biosynthesis
VTDAVDRALALGVLHVGRPESGVRRYGRIIADEASTRPNLRVLTADADVLERRRGGLDQRGRELADADIVWMQWNRRSWGRDARAAQRLIDFRRTFRAPIVVTLHDVFAPRSLREAWLEGEMWNMRLVGRLGRRFVVHSQDEVGRTRGLVPTDRIRVVPHFVEQRSRSVPRDEARARLGVEGRRVVTLLGFIYGRKGHKKMLEAIPRLPDDVLVVYAGGNVAGREIALRNIRERARELRLGDDQLRITGWLDDDQLDDWIAATDLAILPFRDLSASGSLSTWIAAGKPMLVSDLPGFAEYNARVPGALRIASSLEPRVLADAIERELASELPDPDPRVVALRDDLTVAKTLDRYLDVFQEAAAG